MNIRFGNEYQGIIKLNQCPEPPRWRSGREFDSHAGDQDSMPSQDRSKS